MSGANQIEPRIPLAGLLIGGKSRRMGTPKALLEHPDGGTLVEHVAGVLQSVAHRVILLGSCSSLPQTLRHLERVEDATPEGGPLAGLVSLLRQSNGDWVLLCACDMPWVDIDVIRELAFHRSDCVDAIAFQRGSGGGVLHAACAMYHTRVLPTARRELESDKRSLQAVLGSVRVASIVPDADRETQLVNINTAQDYARIKTQAAGKSSV